MTDKLKITIRIADIDIRFEINRDEEHFYRKAEYHINKLWADWRKSSPQFSREHTLARIALAFGEFYYRTSEQISEQESLLDSFEARLDTLLSDSTDQDGIPA